jgi:hypothetical protein
MSPIPLDTSTAAWAELGAVLDEMGGEERLRAAIEMSDSIRLVRLAGIRAMNPSWSDDRVFGAFLRDEYGLDLESDR